jgi:ATP-binding cassette subfamily C protein
MRDFRYKRAKELALPAAGVVESSLETSENRLLPAGVESGGGTADQGAIIGVRGHSLEASAPPPRSPPANPTMQTILFFFRCYPGQTALVLVGLLFASALQVVGLAAALPLLSLAAPSGDSEAASPLMRAVMAALAYAGLEPTLWILVPLIALAILLKAGVVVVAMRQVGYTVARVATDLRLELLRSLTAAGWGYFTRQPVGVAANAIATEADRASKAYLQASYVLAFSLEAAVFFGLALAVSWKLSLGTAALAVVSTLTLNVLVQVTGRAGAKQTRLLKSLLGRLTDALQAVKLLKATGREQLLGPLLEEDTHRLNRALRRYVLSREALRALQDPILVLVALALFLVAHAGLGMPLAEVMLILFLVVRSLETLQKIQRRWQNMIGDSSALWSLRAMILDTQAHREKMSGGEPPHLDRGLELRDVRVRYDDRDVLSDLSLEMPAGRLTAVVGSSGAGKTTLVDLVTGLVRPDAGEILIDGVPLENVDMAAWRRMVGYVPQEMLMLHDTIRANVTLNDPDVDDAEVRRALQDAGAWDFVSALPDGLDSSAGERGSLLSGGQRQRIAIARALVRRPRLLILDEATASLDPETEAAVWATVETLRGKTTVVAISHQPALAGVADHVYRIEGGVAEPVSTAAARTAQEVA